MTDEQLNALYTCNMEHITKLLSDVDNAPLAIAAVMLTQAMSLYRTVLPDEDYDLICESIFEKRAQIRKFEVTVLQ
jgi:hypothetical protein